MPGEGAVTAADRVAGLLTSCAVARPKGRAGCVSAHVWICAGHPGKPGGYREVRQADQACFTVYFTARIRCLHSKRSTGFLPVTAFTSLSSDPNFP